NRDADLAALHVQLAAVAHAHGAADELDGYGHLHGLIGANGVEVDVHRLPAPLVHLDLPDDHAVDVAGDVEVDQAGVADLTERLVEGAHLDTYRHVDLSVVHYSGQATVASELTQTALATLLGCKLHRSSTARRLEP